MRELDNGLSAKVYHSRIEYRGIIQPRGGRTMVEIYSVEEEAPVAVGMARCSLKDNYNKKIGRDIATGRALKELGKNT